MINCGSVFPAYPSFVYLQNKKENYKDFTNILVIIIYFSDFHLVWSEIPLWVNIQNSTASMHLNIPTFQSYTKIIPTAFNKKFYFYKLILQGYSYIREITYNKTISYNLAYNSKRLKIT